MAAACAGLGGQAVNQSWLMLVLSLGQLSKWYGASWNQMLLVWENLGRSEAWTKTSHSYGKNHWKQLGWALKLSGEGPQGIIGVEQCEPGWWSLIYGTHLPALSLSGESAQKRNNGLCQHFCLRESFPQLIALMPDNPVPSHTSLMSFNLLLWCSSSEGASPSKSICRPFKRDCLGIQQFLSSTASIPDGFYRKKLWRLSSWPWNPGLRGLMWGWDPSLLRYPSQFLSSTHTYGTSPFCVSTSPTIFHVDSSLIP